MLCCLTTWSTLYFVQGYWISVQQINCQLFVLSLCPWRKLHCYLLMKPLFYSTFGVLVQMQSYFVWLHARTPPVLNRGANSHSNPPLTYPAHGVRSEPYLLSRSHLSTTDLLTLPSCSCALYCRFSSPSCWCNSWDVSLLFQIHLVSSVLTDFSFSSSVFSFDSNYVCVPKIGVCVYNEDRLFRSDSHHCRSPSCLRAACILDRSCIYRSLWDLTGERMCLFFL